MAGHADDVEPFLARLVRLDAQALVRVQSGPDRTVVWGWVPWNVLVSRTIPGSWGASSDATDQVVRASDWLVTGAALTNLPSLARLDAGWRLPLPPAQRVLIEDVPATTLHDLGAAAAQTLRAAEVGGVGGHAVGSRAVRDALLDHIAIVVSTETRRVEIPQRLVQAVVRMGFVAVGDAPVRVLSAASWIGLAATYGSAWWRPSGQLTVAPVRHRTA
jgi:hypothetical protein